MHWYFRDTDILKAGYLNQNPTNNCTDNTNNKAKKASDLEERISFYDWNENDRLLGTSKQANEVTSCHDGQIARVLSASARAQQTERISQE